MIIIVTTAITIVLLIDCYFTWLCGEPDYTLTDVYDAFLKLKYPTKATVAQPRRGLVSHKSGPGVSGPYRRSFVPVAGSNPKSELHKGPVKYPDKGEEEKSGLDDRVKVVVSDATGVGVHLASQPTGKIVAAGGSSTVSIDRPHSAYDIRDSDAECGISSDMSKEYNQVPRGFNYTQDDAVDEMLPTRRASGGFLGNAFNGFWLDQSESSDTVLSDLVETYDVVSVFSSDNNCPTHDSLGRFAAGATDMAQQDHLDSMESQSSDELRDIYSAVSSDESFLPSASETLPAIERSSEIARRDQICRLNSVLSEGKSDKVVLASSPGDGSLAIAAMECAYSGSSSDGDERCAIRVADGGVSIEDGIGSIGQEHMLGRLALIDKFILSSSDEDDSTVQIAGKFEYGTGERAMDMFGNNMKVAESSDLQDGACESNAANSDNIDSPTISERFSQRDHNDIRRYGVDHRGNDDDSSSGSTFDAILQSVGFFERLSSSSDSDV